MFKAKLLLSLAVIAGIQHFSTPDDMDTASSDHAGRANCGLNVSQVESRAAMVQPDTMPLRGCADARPAALPPAGQRTAV